MASKAWQAARKELKALGIDINTAYRACCLGCVPEEKLTNAEGQPAIYQLAKRWDTNAGGYLNHSNLMPLAGEVVLALIRQGIRVTWDGSDASALLVEFPEEVTA